ncbi:MurR/RpiR family transcriptional regulator [Nitratireductor pacificus]|uniref:RpiR family transcriptional regulator n=1 Tax=Nitratireductor pacificus pht-3B TaxID=391937 RepID=K2MEG2_9HYPH|nr:MurR/RpiR family transcriptional regulator [Nitratireductor pacificus]EKF20551.1 RpiR family transcriptional regulator [Nitratireductor pacificus pht-3B]
MAQATSFGTALEAFDGKLTTADRTLISIILNDPEAALYRSASELAGIAKVHASTVVRLANKLGFDGYPDLQSRLRQDARFGDQPSSRAQLRRDRIERGSNLAKLIESEIAALAAISNTLSQEGIDEAAEYLREARTIFIFGRGSAAPPVAHLDRRLRRIGCRTEVALNMQRRDLAEHLMAVRKNDAVVIFAFQAPGSLPAGYGAVIEYVAEIGARSIVISDATGPTLRPRPDLTLSVTRPDEGEMQLRTGPLLVCEALAMTLAHRDPERAVEGLEALETLRTKLNNHKD